MKYLFVGGAAVLALAFLISGNQAGEGKPKHTIKEVMKAVMAGKDSLKVKFESGKATDDEKAKLVEMMTALAANKAPKGDADSWKEKTTALLAAAKAGDAKSFKAASDCKSCHSNHKGK